MIIIYLMGGITILFILEVWKATRRYKQELKKLNKSMGIDE